MEKQVIDVSLNKKEVLSKFLSRIKTQDRDGRIPMRVIQKILGKNKRWKSILENYALSTSFIISDDGKTKITLKEIEKLVFTSTNKNVLVFNKSNKQYDVYTEVFNRKYRNGGCFIKLVATAMKELTLDHDFPIACAFDLGMFPTISSLNDSYSDFVSALEINDYKPSKLASLFMNDKGDSLNIDENKLIDELEKLFNLCPLTVMFSKYNTSKNSNYEYCDKATTCNFSKIKKALDSIS